MIPPESPIICADIKMLLPRIDAPPSRIHFDSALDTDFLRLYLNKHAVAFYHPKLSEKRSPIYSFGRRVTGSARKRRPVDTCTWESVCCSGSGPRAPSIVRRGGWAPLRMTPPTREAAARYLSRAGYANRPIAAGAGPK